MNRNAGQGERKQVDHELFGIEPVLAHEGNTPAERGRNKMAAYAFPRVHSRKKEDRL